jgi:glutamyl-tRNA synthetase
MTNKTASSRVRFAPSPTGRAHLGAARTALYNYLFARQLGGEFILRIEDTDQKRFVEGAEEELMAGLRWLGIEWDEGPDIGGPCAPYRQSERKEIYQKYAQQLIDDGYAYPCFCAAQRLAEVRNQQMKNKQNPRYDGTCRDLSIEEANRRIADGEKHVVRFKMPREGSTTITDVVRGEITVEHTQLDDTILVKSDGLAVYHLAAMVDDHLMGITHVIRGSEWLPSFPLHGRIYAAFGWEMPEFVHLSVFLKPSGKGKMSKREAAEAIKDGHSIFVQDLRDLGYLPEAVVNWIALMGWSYDDRSEFFTLADLVNKFSLERLNPSPAAIDFTRFDHFNGLHIRALADSDLAELLKPFLAAAGIVADDTTLLRIAPLVKERLVTLDDIVDWAAFFFKENVNPLPEDLVAKKLDAAQSAQVARRAFSILSGLPNAALETTEEPLRQLVAEMELKPGQVFGVLRAAVTGQKVSPPLFESMEIIGREMVLERVQHAAELLEELAATAASEG